MRLREPDGYGVPVLPLSPADLPKPVVFRTDEGRSPRKYQGYLLAVADAMDLARVDTFREDPTDRHDRSRSLAHGKTAGTNRECRGADPKSGPSHQGFWFGGGDGT